MGFGKCIDNVVYTVHTWGIRFFFEVHTDTRRRVKGNKRARSAENRVQ